MEPLASVAFLLAGALLGVAGAWFTLRRIHLAECARAVAVAQAAVAESKAAELRAAHDEITRRKTEEATFATRIEDLGRAQTQLRDAFQSLCGEALRNNNDAFLQLARTELEKIRAASHADLEQRQTAIDALLAPIREGLEKYDQKLHAIERSRAESFGALAQRLDSVSLASGS